MQLPFALIPVLAFNASSTLMGKFVNGRGMIACTVGIALAVMLVNVSGVLAFFEAALSGASMYVWASVAAAMVLYLLFVGYLFLHSTAAAGLLPPIIGFVAQQPGGASRDSVGGGVFVQVPYEPSSEDGSSDAGDAEEGDEEAAAGSSSSTDLIRALRSPDSQSGAAGLLDLPSPGSSSPPAAAAGAGSSSSGAGASSSYSGSPGAAWLSDYGSAAASAVGVADPEFGGGREQQQLQQPLLPHVAPSRGRRM